MSLSCSVGFSPLFKPVVFCRFHPLVEIYIYIYIRYNLLFKYKPVMSCRLKPWSRLSYEIHLLSLSLSRLYLYMCIG